MLLEVNIKLMCILEIDECFQSDAALHTCHQVGMSCYGRHPWSATVLQTC